MTELERQYEEETKRMAKYNGTPYHGLHSPFYVEWLEKKVVSLEEQLYERFDEQADMEAGK